MSALVLLGLFAVIAMGAMMVLMMVDTGASDRDDGGP